MRRTTRSLFAVKAIRDVFIVAAVAFPSLTFAQDPNITYKRVLLPVLAPTSGIPGSFGSVWKTSVTLLNNSTAPVSVYPYATGGPICVVCTEQPPTPPGVTFHPGLGSDDALHHGRFVYIDGAHIDDIQINLRVQDVSRGLETWGTALPVIREDRFRNARFSLTDIPTEPHFRHTLRIYGLAAARPTSVSVVIYKTDPAAIYPDAPTDERIGQFTFELVIPDLPAFYPRYFELGNLASLTPFAGVDRFRIDVEPQDADSRIWGFLTVTDDATQHVTVVEPSR